MEAEVATAYIQYAQHLRPNRLWRGRELDGHKLMTKPTPWFSLRKGLLWEWLAVIFDCVYNLIILALYSPRRNVEIRTCALLLPRPISARSLSAAVQELAGAREWEHVPAPLTWVSPIVISIYAIWCSWRSFAFTECRSKDLWSSTPQTHFFGYSGPERVHVPAPLTATITS